ncbi:glycosyltransferase family 4 protein [bacterium]|nr:glycosyltransferase family 4 protein [bacterium]
MVERVLHILTQRPGLTGSGVTLDALTRCAAASGIAQRALVGVPAGADCGVASLSRDEVAPLRFESGALPFAVPGMSDVMPYPSTIFSAMDAERLSVYRAAWRAHIARALAEFRPQVIHAHHLWLVGAMLKDLAPDTPVVSHCHATGLRQMSLCPHLADDVRRGCRRNDVVAVLHGGHAVQVARELDLPPSRIRTVGAGYRDDVFRCCEGGDRAERILYVGKYSLAKGLPCLLDAVEALAATRPGCELHVVGDGAGPEADALRERMRGMSPRVVLHGVLTQEALAVQLNRCAVCVLPSFYEGVPLVLAEALACGCRLVCSDLPGVRDQLADPFSAALDLVPLPRLEGIDRPLEADLPGFVDALAASLDAALARPPLGDPAVTLPGALLPFTWSAVYGRVAAIWRELAAV